MKLTNKEHEERRMYMDGSKDYLTVAWDTANIVEKGKVLIHDKEGWSKVDISWVLSDTLG